MLRLVFNGYYRSGTTLIYRILKLSNPEALVLYEPLHPRLFHEISSKGGERLHGFYPWRGYLKRSFLRIKEEYETVLKEIAPAGEGDLIPFHFETVRPLFDLLHDLEVDVVLQTNRCHFILNSISRTYGCKVAHIMRNPADVWLSIITAPLRKRTIFRPLSSFLRENLFGRWISMRITPKISSVGRLFFLKDDLELLAEKYKVPMCRDYLDAMLVIWTYFNRSAVKQVVDSEGVCISYEWLTDDPQNSLSHLSKETSLRFDRFPPIQRRRKCSRETLRYVTHRIEKLGLSDVLREILELYMEKFKDPNWGNIMSFP